MIAKAAPKTSKKQSGIYNMKLTLTQSDLNHALRTVSRAIASRPSHPVLAHVLLAAANGELRLTAYNLDLGITTAVVAMVDTAGAITIPYRLLADIIGRLDPADVVTLLADGDAVTIKTVSGSYKLPGGPSEDYPALPAVEASGAASVAFEAAVMPAAATDEAKQILNGIHIRVANGVMTQEATDGHRLSIRHTRPLRQIWTSPSRSVTSSALMVMSSLPLTSNRP